MRSDVPNDQSELVLNVRGGARLSVPLDLSQITPYVLLEQEDWFEDEIRFVRRWLRPGMQAVDVGASFGVYAVSMARAVGRSGRLWAFEPTPTTADFLRRNLELNGCAQATVEQTAISDAEGPVPFASGVYSEWNAIAAAGAAADDAIQVNAVTLDRVAASAGWGKVDFVKLDVEGHELEAIHGGADFLAENSPLLMFEIKLEKRFDLRALAPLSEKGYQFFRLLPGPLMLTPFDALEPIDSFQLNLFACKDDRAWLLAADGFLADPQTFDITTPSNHAWIEYARSAPYARDLAGRWTNKAGFFSCADRFIYLEGLAAFAHSRDSNRQPSERVAWLGHAFQCVAEAIAAADTLSRRISYARLAWELGQRTTAVDALDAAVGRVSNEADTALQEPFLAPSPRYEQLSAGADSEDWLRCAVIEQYEKLRSFSSIFAQGTSLEVVEPIRGLGYCSAEIERRRQLVRLAHGMQEAPEPEARLCVRSEENLNSQFWCSQRA